MMPYINGMSSFSPFISQRNSQPTNTQIPHSENMNYYQESVKLTLANLMLSNQIQQVTTEKKELLAKISAIEKKLQDVRDNPDSYDLTDDKKKRIRRNAVEIKRNYKCPVETCKKAYGSEGSLTQHIKLKHEEIFKHYSSFNIEKPKKNDKTPSNYEENEENEEKNEKKIRKESENTSSHKENYSLDPNDAKSLHKNIGNK